MTKHWRTYLQDAGTTAHAVFFMPADWLLSQLAAYAPAVASTFGIHDGGPLVLRAGLALLLWSLAALSLSRAVRSLGHGIRAGFATMRSSSFRVGLGWHCFRTTWLGRLGAIGRRAGLESTDARPELELDAVDLAVLRSAAALGAGFALSAPDLAGELGLRPAQVQQSLDKLSRERMLDHAIGSTDDFDHYRLSRAGAAFVAFLRRSHGAA